MSFARFDMSAKYCLTFYFKTKKQTEKGKFANIGFAIVESHVHIKENPKASLRCDGQTLSFHLFQNAGYLFTCRLPLDKSCNIKNGVYYETRYCCGEVSAPVC